MRASVDPTWSSTSELAELLLEDKPSDLPCLSVTGRGTTLGKEAPVSLNTCKRLTVEGDSQ